MVSSLRMSVWDFAKFKNLQLSICAEFEEETIIRNREVQQGGRQIRVWQYVCTTTRNNKKLLKHPPKPHQAPDKKINPLRNWPHNWSFFTISFSFQYFWIIFAKKYPVPSSSTLGWSDRDGGSGWVSPPRVETSCSRQLFSETGSVTRSETGMGWFAGLITRKSQERTKICTTTTVVYTVYCASWSRPKNNRISY